MYLSRLKLNPTQRRVWREFLRNPYKIHQMVMRGFPDGVKREEAEVLHRLEVSDEAIILLAQSNLEPDWSKIESRYLAPVDPFDFLPNPAIKPLDLPLQQNQILSFRLCANPAIKKMRWDENGQRKKNSNRVPLLREEQQLAWLQQKGEQHGFTLLQATVGSQIRQKGWKQKGAPPVTLYTVQFDGRLQVTHPDMLLKAIQTGIGPARAFGCGLLSLARG